MSSDKRNFDYQANLAWIRAGLSRALDRAVADGILKPAAGD